MAVRSGAPKALWGTVDIGDPGQASAALGPDQVAADTLFGGDRAARQAAGRHARVLIKDMLYAHAPTVTLPMNPPAPPAPAPVAAPGPVAATIAARADVRAAIVAAAQRRGQLACFDARAIDVPRTGHRPARAARTAADGALA